MDSSEAIVVHLMIAFSIILPGLIMKGLVNSEPNKWAGYRTKWSMKSQKTWEFAQQYSAKLMLWDALVVITLQLTSYFLLDTEKSVILTCVLMIIGLAVVITMVEIELRKRFDKEGQPKSQSISRND